MLLKINKKNKRKNQKLMEYKRKISKNQTLIVKKIKS